MIMAHHLAGDGKSIIYLIKDIMNALAKKPLTYKPLVLLKKNSFSDTRLGIMKYLLKMSWDKSEVTNMGRYRTEEVSTLLSKV